MGETESMRLAVSEIFGPTVQGEGPLAGWPAVFLRLMGCNLRCRWCDTPYTWDGSRFDLKAETRRLEPEHAAERISDIMGGKEMLLVVTGGEPMLQQHALAQLLQHLPQQRVQVETAGTVPPLPILDVSYVVSPKLHHSGNNGSRYVPAALNALRDTGRVDGWKFVLAGVRDYREVDWMVEQHQLAPVYIMAEGTDSWRLAERLAELAPDAIERGYRLTPRLHIDLFGNRRGV